MLTGSSVNGRPCWIARSPTPFAQAEQTSITRELTKARSRLDGANDDLAAVERGLELASELIADCHRLYLTAPQTMRRQLNKAVFEQLSIEHDDVAGASFRQPFQGLLRPSPTQTQDASHDERLLRRLPDDFPAPNAIEKPIN